jgi:hypothetical protein
MLLTGFARQRQVEAEGTALVFFTGEVDAAAVLVDEMLYLHNHDWVYPQIVFHFVLTFLTQAAFGAALLRTG